jgi:nitroreductase
MGSDGSPRVDVDAAATDHLLTTTRSVRKRLDFDRAVPRSVIDECLEIAVQAPTGSNSQGWHFIVIEEPDVKLALAELYRRGFGRYGDMAERPRFDGDDPRAGQMGDLRTSAAYLNDRLHEVPAMVVPCIEGRWEKLTVFHQAASYGSIFPAVWSFMLALRSRGIGSSLTSMHLMYEAEAAEILGVPDGVTQVGLVPIGYYLGEAFRAADRIPAVQRTYWNRWADPADAVDESSAE